MWQPGSLIWDQMAEPNIFVWDFGTEPNFLEGYEVMNKILWKVS